MQRITIRTTSLALSIAIAVYWSNAILFVSQEATAVVLSKSDLEELVDNEEEATRPAEEKPPQPATDETPRKPATAPAASQTTQDEPPPASQPRDEAAGLDEPLTAGHDEAAALPSDAALAEQVLVNSIDNADANDHSQPLESGSPNSQPATPLLLGGGEAMLSSFDGSSTQSDGSSNHGVTGGSGLGPSFDIRIMGQPATANLRRLKGARLAAVRQRRGYTEVVLVNATTISTPQRVESLVQTHPEFTNRKGIVLEDRWLADVEDRLLTYGGGWQTWLLIEDAMFADWLRKVREDLARRKLAWEEVARVEATIQVRQVGERVHAVFAVGAVQRKPPPPTKPTAPGTDRSQTTRSSAAATAHDPLDQRR